MAKRKFKLTWQKGDGNRPGRWRKIIDGKAYHFDGGSGKFDHAAYTEAVAAYEKLKAEVTTQNNPYRAEYTAAIREWEAVAIWCKENGDLEQLKIAEAKAQDLKSRLISRKCKPLARDDHFVTQVGFPMVNVKDLGVKRIDDDAFVVEADVATVTTWEHQQAVWKDRIETVKHRAGTPDDWEHSIFSVAESFIKTLHRKVNDKAISPGRFANLQASVSMFQSFVGSSKGISGLDGRQMSDFYKYLQEKIDNKSFSPSTGRDHATNVGQFLRWAWKQEHIDSLPRNLADHEISVPATRIEVYTSVEIEKLLSSASARCRLYILMALNLGMTQQDISDLHPSEVNWKTRQVSRKRSKTKKHENTPMVTYKLWPETALLLKRFKVENQQHVLLNKFGLPLKDQEIADDKYRKTDTVGREFRRLKKKCNISGRSFISLKKLLDPCWKTTATTNPSQNFSLVELLEPSVRNTMQNHLKTGWQRRQIGFESN